MEHWLKTTQDIQTETYGKDPATLRGLELRSYLHWNFTACVVELAEAIEESRWKPWAAYEEGDEIIPDKKAILTEFIDAQMFIANMLVSAGVTDEEYAEAYREKWNKNIARQEKEGGYQSRRGIDKCVLCRRSFDDVGQFVDGSGTDTDLCQKCGHDTLGWPVNV